MLLLVIVSDNIVFSRHSEFVSPILACLSKNGDNMLATLTTELHYKATRYHQMQDSVTHGSQTMMLLDKS